MEIIIENTIFKRFDWNKSLIRTPISAVEPLYALNVVHTRTSPPYKRATSLRWSFVMCGCRMCHTTVQFPNHNNQAMGDGVCRSGGGIFNVRTFKQRQSSQWQTLANRSRNLYYRIENWKWYVQRLLCHSVRTEWAAARLYNNSAPASPTCSIKYIDNRNGVLQERERIKLHRLSRKTINFTPKLRCIHLLS